jgi:addiction module HigA family antidote
MSMHNPPHPGEFILETYLEPHDLSARYLAEKLGVAASTLNRVLRRQSGVSPEMALRLSKVLSPVRTPAQQRSFYARACENRRLAWTLQDSALVGTMESDKTALLNGPRQELFTDGGLSGEGRLKSGKRHGKWTFYDKSGSKKAVGKYLDGELDGYWEW